MGDSKLDVRGMALKNKNAQIRYIKQLPNVKHYRLNLLGMIVFQRHQFVAGPFFGENQGHIFSLSFHLDQMCLKLSEKIKVSQDRSAGSQQQSTGIYVLYGEAKNLQFFKNFLNFKFQSQPVSTNFNVSKWQKLWVYVSVWTKVTNEHAHHHQALCKMINLCKHKQ